MMKPDFDFVTQEEAARPKDGLCEIYLDCWWPVADDGRIAFYGRTRGRGGAALGNRSKAIARRFVEREDTWVDVVQLPVVIRPASYSESQRVAGRNYEVEYVPASYSESQRVAGRNYEVEYVPVGRVPRELQVRLQGAARGRRLVALSTHPGHQDVLVAVFEPVQP